MPGKGIFHTLDLEKAFSFRGRSPLTPTGDVAHGPTGGWGAGGGGGGGTEGPRTPTFRLSDFPPFPSLKMVSDTSGSGHSLGLIIQICLILLFLLHI